MNKKAQSEVIAVMLILGITVAAVAVAYRWAAPRVQESQNKSRIDSMIGFMEELDRKIREVANAGEGSQRFIDVEFDKGQILIHPPPGNNVMYQLVSYTLTPAELPANKNLPYGSYLRIRQNEENQDIIEVVLEYTDVELEAEVPEAEEVVLSPMRYTIYIRNMGGNVVRLSREPAYIGTTERFLLSGYVYDNSGDEGIQLSPDADGDYIKDEENEIIPNAEILLLDSQGNVVTSTRSNSHGKYALLLQRRLTAEAGQYYFVVSKSSYVMKEWDGSVENVKCEKYTKDFDSTSPEGWDFSVSPYEDRDEIRIDFPLYKVEPPDVLENAPIAIIVDHQITENKGIVYDIRDALDNDENTHCGKFIVYGNVSNPDQTVAGEYFQYPGTSDPIYAYPLEWLLDPDEARGVDEYGWGDADLNDRFTQVASIGGEEDKIDYHDFSLIVVGTGAIQQSGLLTTLQTYRDTFTNFVSLGRFTLNGIEYARGLVVFPQIQGYGSYDPLLYYYDGTKRPTGSYTYDDGVEVTDETMESMHNDGEVDENFFLQDAMGHDDERYGSEEAYSWLPQFMGEDLRLTSFTGVTNSQGITIATLTSFSTPQDVVLQATAQGASVQTSIEFFRRITVETRHTTLGANGADETTITATVRDENGVLMDSENVTFTTDAGTFAENPGNQTYSLTTDSDGVATATLVAGSSATTATVQCELDADSSVYGTLEVDFDTGITFRLTEEDDNGDGTFNDSGDYFDYKLAADGSSQAKFTAAVVAPSLVNPISGQKVYFYTDHGSLSSSTATADANGNCEVTLTSDAQPRKDNTVMAEIKLYDNGECVYSDEDANNEVSAGDIRLDSNCGDVNSTVTSGDSDIGNELTEFNFYEKYYDDDGSGNYTSADTVYRDTNDDGDVDAGDYRITYYHQGGADEEAPGEVQAGDNDVGNVLTAFASEEKFVNSTINYQKTVDIDFVGTHAYTTLTSDLGEIPLTRLGDTPIVAFTELTATVYDSQGTAIPAYIESNELTFSTTLGHFPYSQDKDGDSSNGWQRDTDNEGKATIILYSYEDDNDVIDGSAGEEAVSGTATVYEKITGEPDSTKRHTSVDFVSGICFPSCPSIFEIENSTSISTQVYDSEGEGIPGVKVTYSLDPESAGSVVPDESNKRYNFYEVHRTRGGVYAFYYLDFWWWGIEGEGIDTFEEGNILYDHEGAHGEYSVDVWVKKTFDYDATNSKITGYTGSEIFSDFASYEMDLDVHGLFDITDTGWENFDVAMIEKDLPRKTHKTTYLTIYTAEYIVYEIQGGPTMLIKENRDEYNEMVQNVILTTIDFDRYGNNYGQHDGDSTTLETDGNFHTDVPGQRSNAIEIEKNMVLYAIGHEELI